MRVQCFVYIAASVDGYIARPDGDIEWLHNPDYEKAPLEGLGYEEFISDIDAIVMGRHSFEKVLSFGDWPYEGTVVVVLTSSDLAIPEELASKVQIASGKPRDIVKKLAADGQKRLYIDGGATIQNFLREGLIDEITITQIPILLGEGISLFESIGKESPLELINAHKSENGFVQVRYRVLSRA